MGETQTKQERTGLTEAQLAMELLKRKIVTEAHLKAAIDYQESVGGRLLDILVKLGLVRAKTMDEFIERLAKGEPVGKEANRKPLSEPPDPAKLKLHRKLLEKVPRDVALKYGVLLFFPPPGTRAILISTEPRAPDTVIEELQALLGIELEPIRLDSKVRARFLPPGLGQPSGPPPTRREQPTQPAQKDGPAEAELLRALINLLIRKQLIQKDELQVELELLRRRKP